LDADWQEIARDVETVPATKAPANQVNSDELVYVIYTSGTTGQPRGVLVSHRNLVHSTIARMNYYPEPVNNFLLLSSFAFDSSVAGIFWTLCQGGTLVLPQQGLEQDIRQLTALIAKREVSHILCLPSLYSLILEHAAPQKLKSLQTVIVAGEACPQKLVRPHYELLPQTLLYNEYGPAEGTVWCTVYEIPSQDMGRQIPIGRPIANTQIYLLDAHQQPVPTGVPGELYIGGDGLAQGYLNRPELTAERFIDHPFSDEPLARLYRTGDLARYLPDGNLEFLGRVDRQVKIRGNRVEMEEIEAVLRQHSALRDAAVVDSDDGGGIDRALDLANTETLVTQIMSLGKESAGGLLTEIEKLSEDETEVMLTYGD
jgi:amino acid adenylation domain-containing protein